MSENTVQHGSEIGSQPMHGATDAGRGSSARVGGEIGTAAASGRTAPAADAATGTGRGSSARAGGAKVPGTHERWWTGDEIALLRRLWSDTSVTTDAIPGLLRDRSRKAMRQMVALLGLGPRPRKALYKDGRPAPYSWTEADDERLRSLWHKMSRHDVAKAMDRSAHSVSHRASFLKLGASQFTRQLVIARAVALLAEVHEAARKLHEWTEDEIAVLREDWPDIERIHERTGRSWSGIERKAHKLGLPPKSGCRREALPADRLIERTTKAEERLTVRHDREALVARKCLNCQRPFQAPGRFIRLCDLCRGRSEGLL